MSDLEVAKVLTLIGENLNTKQHLTLTETGNLPSTIIAGVLIEIKLALFKTANELMKDV